MSLELFQQKNTIELQEQQVKQLRASLEESFSSKIVSQIMDLCKEKAKLEVKEIHKLIEPKIFTSCEDFLNELLYEDEIEAATLREYIKNFNPSVLLKTLSDVINVKSTWSEYNNFCDEVTNHTLFADILKRHKASSDAFISFQKNWS